MSEHDTAYDALNFDGLERRANYRVIALREDILIALDRKDAAAIIFHIIWRWQIEVRREELLKEIERRKRASMPPLSAEEVDERMWIYMSYNDFVRESGGAVAYNTVIRMLDYLVNTKKVLEQRENHNPHFPDYEYRINKDVVRELLNGLPISPVFVPKVPKRKEQSTQMGTADIQSTQMGTGYTQEGRATTQMGTGVYPNGGTYITGTTQVSTDTSQRERIAPSTSDASAHTTASALTPDMSSEHKAQKPPLLLEPGANAIGSPPAEDKSKTNTPRGSRKPKGEKPINVVEPERIKKVYEYFDELGREVSGDAQWTYERSKVSDGYITDMLAVPNRIVTKDSLRAVYLKMWNTPPDPKTGFSWKDNMTVKAVCRNYGHFLLSINGKDKLGKQPQETVSGRQRVEVPDDILAAMMAAGGGY